MSFRELKVKTPTRRPRNGGNATGKKMLFHAEVRRAKEELPSKKEKASAAARTRKEAEETKRSEKKGEAKTSMGIHRSGLTWVGK